MKRATRNTPPPGFFISVAATGLRDSVSSLDATLVGSFASVDSKWVSGAQCLHKSNWDGPDDSSRKRAAKVQRFEGVRRTVCGASIVRGTKESCQAKKNIIAYWYSWSMIIINGLDRVG